MSALALSVLLSIVSAVAYAGGAIVQERVAASSPGEQYAPLRRAGWWAAVALNGLGGLLHVVALAYGPLSVVQPLGALTIVFALPMAALFVGRKAGATAWRGAIMATVGLAGLLSLVGTSDAQSLGGPQQVAVFTATAVAVVALMIAGRAAHRHPAVRAMLLATASGIAFGMSSVFTKTVAVDWTGGVSAGDLPPLAAIGVLATAGLLLSQASYRGAGLAAPLATLTVVNPVVAAAVGITMFGETFRYGTTGTVLALGCGVVAAGGLILLTTERIARSQDEAEDRDAVQDRAQVQDEARDRTQDRAEEPLTAVIVPAAAETSAAVAAVAVPTPVAQAVMAEDSLPMALSEPAPSIPATPAAATAAASASVPKPRAGLGDDEPAARAEEPVFLPSPVAEGVYENRAPTGPAPGYASLYGGVFLPPPALDRRRRIRVRS
ncbi:drug/metabolite transporter (DMT)-like permease [Streptomyces glaucescens]